MRQAKDNFTWLSIPCIKLEIIQCQSWRSCPCVLSFLPQPFQGRGGRQSHPSSLALQQPVLPAAHASWRMLFQGNAAYALHTEMWRCDSWMFPGSLWCTLPCSLLLIMNRALVTDFTKHISELSYNANKESWCEDIEAQLSYRLNQTLPFVF